MSIEECFVAVVAIAVAESLPLRALSHQITLTSSYS